MKLLYIPLDYHRHEDSPELFTDMLDAFNEPFEARICTGVGDAIMFDPDIIFFQGGMEPDMLREVKRNTKAKVFMWTGDCRYIPQPSLMMYRDIVDVFLLPFNGNILKRYKKMLNKPCHFIFEPIQKWRFRDPKNMDKGDVVFVGNYYNHFPGGENRLRLADFIGRNVKEFRMYGSVNNVGMIDNDKVPQLYNDAYCVIAENNMHDITAYFTPRNIGGMSAGSCVLMRYFPLIDNFFTDGEDCLIYRSEYELLDLINFLKDNPDVRNRLAINGHKKAQEHFSPKNFVSNFKTLYEISSSNS